MINLAVNLWKSVKENRLPYFLIAGAIFAIYSLWINFYSLRIFDPDNLYHIKHAWLYMINGIFETSFPWVQYSVINRYSSDLWYGFHIFLIPFTIGDNLIWGVYLASAVITWTSLFLYFLTFVRLNLAFPIFWPLFLPISSLYIMARLSVTRPHPLSMGLHMLLFSYLVKGGPWPVFIISALASFIHLNLFWIPIIALGVISVGRLINNQPLEIRKGGALLGGIIVGALIKPNPFQALKLNYIQLVDIIIIKWQKIGLAFGKELYPFTIWGINTYMLVFIVFNVALFSWLVYKKHIAKTSTQDKIAMWTLLSLSVLFLILSIFTASRAFDFFMSFFLLFVAYNLTFLIRAIKDKSTESRYNVIWGLILLLFIVYIIFTNLMGLGDYFDRFKLLPDAYEFQNSANWLALNTKPGEIVFNVSWDTFPFLFFWNHHNYYINGMDPIFMYKNNPSLYWEYHFLSNGQGGEYTCSSRKCDSSTAVKSYDVLVNHFKASYIHIYPPTNSKFFEYLKSTPDKFEISFVGQSDVVFRIIK